MLFPTIEFAVFFAVVFAVSWALNRQNTAKKAFLVAASYFFYGFWSVHYLAMLAGSSAFNWGLALLIGALTGRARLWALLFGVVANLALLAYFKYFNFFVASFVNAFAAIGVPLHLPFVEVALPIAISFLTFHALSYIIDVYRGVVKPTRSLLDILFYISFFPHLVAGPIVRAKNFLAQTVRPSNPADILLGASVILIVGGLFKKVVVANYLGTEFVDPIFQNPTGQSRLDLLLGMYAYGLQIYCDFSAYTDIAIGVANILGYQFPQNFNQPYRALSVQDFWRRWHMTLSAWLRDYLYIPLGGNRGGRLATYRNILITMGLGGLWHGANWNFVIWGLLHGAALVVERALGITNGDRPRRRWSAWLAWLVTFHFVCLTWVFFRSPTLADSMDYFRTLFLGGGSGTLLTPLVVAMFFFGALSQVIPPRWWSRAERWYDEGPLVAKIALPAFAILAVAMAAPSGVAPFIYFQF
ncbi:MAG TPA: MBOAT family protein [Xanthobacteraceae bacterium]|nr:MBOAT family protein [Xanthobacteraceae bacterium]